MKKYIYTILVFWVFSCCGGLFAQSTLTNLTVIGNKTGFDNLSVKDVRQIFRGKYSRWPQGGEVTIVLPSPKSDNALPVAQNIYLTTVSGVQKFWLALVFQGRSTPPVFLETDEEIIMYVKKTAGAIGVVSSGSQNIPRNLIISINN